jgi:pyruvate/2-oxoglutarate/acetoin dehydrogenase E1 component
MASVLESLNNALHRAFADSDLIYLLGEDVLDPYGGAFKVTKGLSTVYPDRVLTTPISEAGFVGAAAGMALRGLRPVVEIMFGDFITLMADQLVNHISKFRWMYNDQVTVPLVIRTPMGGRRGYGPTHSQTLEKLYLGLPGLQVIAPAPFCQVDGSGSPGDILYHCILQGTDPTLFLENKLGYLLPVQGQPDLKDFELTSLPTNHVPGFPVYRLGLRAAPPPTLTIAAYGYMAELARQALERLAFERELFAELIIPTRLAPFEVSPIIESSSRTGALLVIEEGTYTLGWGAEVVARVAEASTGQMLTVRRLAAQDLPIPVSPRLEQAILPGVEHIVQSAIEMVA